MKLTLENEEQKMKLLMAAKNLRKLEEGGWTKVFIHPDLTPKQREERKVLIKQLKERRLNGETNLISVKGEIVESVSIETRASCTGMNNLKCFYTNANSLFGKLDEFRDRIKGFHIAVPSTKFLIMGDFNNRNIDYLNYTVSASEESNDFKFFQKTQDPFLFQNILQDARCKTPCRSNFVRSRLRLHGRRKFH